jgi:hypothetical protein
MAIDWKRLQSLALEEVEATLGLDEDDLTERGLE